MTLVYTPLPDIILSSLSLLMLVSILAGFIATFAIFFPDIMIPHLQIIVLVGA